MKYYVIGFAVVCMIIPGLTINYGIDADAWRSIIAAENLLYTGHYDPSRLPGNPLFEYLLMAPAAIGGHLLSNLLIFASYGLCIAGLYMIVQSYANWPILVVMFSLTPILLVNSSQTMDYIPGLALLLWSYVAALRRKGVWAYVLTGLAIGFRFPNVLFLIPLCLFFMLEGTRLRKVILLTMLSLCVGLVWYAPIFATYGFKTLEIPAHSYTGLSYLLFAGYNFSNVFGIIATVGLVMILTINFRSIMRKSRQALLERDNAFIAEVVVVLVFSLIFVRHADESAYLIPAIPFFYLLLSRWLKRKTLVIATILILSFSFVSIDLKGGQCGRRTMTFKPAAGIVVRNYLDRKKCERLRAGVSSFGEADKAIILHGHGPVLGFKNRNVEHARYDDIFPHLKEKEISDKNSIHRLPNRQVFFVSGMSENNIKIAQREGYKVFCFSDIAPGLCLHTYGYDPYAIGVTKLDISDHNAFYRKSKN